MKDGPPGRLVTERPIVPVTPALITLIFEVPLPPAEKLTDGASILTVKSVLTVTVTVVV